jgi:hypothetical protein
VGEAGGHERANHWARLDEALRTNAADSGCDAAREVLDLFAELVANGASARLRFPGVSAHVGSCDQCRDDLAGLLAYLSWSATLPEES